MSAANTPPKDGGPGEVALPREGDVIAGKLRVERVIGAGGMGVVVAARHLSLGQLVAVKMLRPGPRSEPMLVARFLREARACAAIQSEHVARVLDVGELEGGAPYIVMEHLAGNDLEELLEAHGKLPVNEAVDYVLQACEAVAEAHKLGIVHRDLKPSNLFLARKSDGSPLVKVLDFGIAKAFRADAMGDDPGLTNTGCAMGSPRYMSPEQVRNAKDVDARADVWALGVVLYELVTGRPPFDDETAAALCAAIVADPHTPVRKLLPEAPEELVKVLDACLQKDRAKRLADVGLLARRLAPLASTSFGGYGERVSRVLGGRGGTAQTLPERPTGSSTPSGDWAGETKEEESREDDAARTHSTFGGAKRPPERRTTKWITMGVAAVAAVIGLAAVFGRSPTSTGSAPAKSTEVTQPQPATTSRLDVAPDPTVAPVGASPPAIEPAPPAPTADSSARRTPAKGAPKQKPTATVDAKTAQPAKEQPPPPARDPLGDRK